MTRSLGLLGALLLCLGAAPAGAEPKVCGNQRALGDFSPAGCPALHDDGVAPDEVKGDGIYTAAVQLQPTALLKYKILPSGAFGPDEIRQASECGPPGQPSSPERDIQIAGPDVLQPSRFYYDSRSGLDASFQPPGPAGGDSLMTTTPAGVRWLAVGDFQDKIFDAAQGAVELRPMADGIFLGEVTVTKGLPAGWHWKVLEDNKKGTYDDTRKLGPAGWSYSPCDSDNAAVQQEVLPGARLQLGFNAHLGRLQTTVTNPCCDDPVPRELGAAPGDGPTGEADLGDPVPLPGIRCNCRVGGAGAGAGLGGTTGPLLLSLLPLLLLRRLRRRNRSSFSPGRRSH